MVSGYRSGDPPQDFCGYYSLRLPMIRPYNDRTYTHKEQESLPRDHYNRRYYLRFIQPCSGMGLRKMNCLEMDIASFGNERFFLSTVQSVWYLRNNMFHVKNADTSTILLFLML